MPLVEIVSEPDLRTSEQAKEYAAELRAILLATEVSDAKMEEGSMRVDANVSVNRAGEPWGTRCEIKNLNSLRSLGRAIEHEALRQIDLLEAGERVRQETRHWDEAVRPHRHPPREGGRRRLPVLPRARPRAARPHRRRHRAHRRRAARRCPPTAAPRWPPPPAGSRPTTPSCSPSQRDLDALAAAAIAAGADAGRVLTHVEHNLAVDGAESLSAEHLAALVQMETGGELTATQAKTVLAEVVATGKAPGRRSPRRRASRRSTPARSRASSTRSSPPTPRSGRTSAPATTRPAASSPASSWAR